MKRNLTLLWIICSCFGFAQIPAGYYNTATGNGYVLKNQLHNIIKNHSDQGYGALWTLFTTAAFRDNYYENNGSLLDIYSENPLGADSYEFFDTSDQCGSYNSEGDCYNREHLIPQSYFDGFAIDPMKNDPFFVVPSDGWVNNSRNNFPFGEVDNPSYTSTNGSKKGTNLVSAFSNYNGTVFEPLDEFKGDIARAFFYFATRYEDVLSDFYNTSNASTCQSKNMFDGSLDKAFSDDFILILIKWHKQDPVSAKEIAQNNAIYTHQGNRNPFIDNANFVCAIWTTQCATVDALNNENFAQLEQIKLYPNPTSSQKITLETKIQIDDIQLISINGQVLQKIQNPIAQNSIYTFDNLAAGVYFLKITAGNQFVTKKIIVH